jgi:peptidoglycan/LPS O-acetylase OafA/YrhL
LDHARVIRRTTHVEQARAQISLADNMQPNVLTPPAQKPRPHERPHPAQAVASGYRTDIDGLRAVAVLPVVGFHAGIHFLRGGFIGVDVFFVISGFLITQLLYKDICAERFSIIHFYERRIRRIFPALFAVLLSVYVVGIIYCLPAEIVDLSKSLAAAALSVSNIYFWLTSGYFDGQSSAKPLLHTWSLAVEEQYYLVWPVLLFALNRLPRPRLLQVMLVLVCLSLAGSVAGMWLFPSANFYLPFTRAWELGAGALLALDALPMQLGPRLRNVLSALGMLLIVGSVLLIGPDLPFPGLLAVPPCLGTVLIILAGRDGDSHLGRLLSLRPVVFMGLISYSLYLWHWPITVFQKNYGLLVSGLSDARSKIVIILVSLLLAAFSWKFIEQPFRTGQLRPSNRRLLQIAAAAMSVVLTLALLASLAKGFPGRYSPRELQIASYLSYLTSDEGHNFGRRGECFLVGGSGERSYFAHECLVTAKDRKNYLLLGDSHAAELWAGLSATFPGVNFLEAAASECFPTIVHAISESARCKRLMDDVLQNFLAHERVDRVLLAARWKSTMLDNLLATVSWLNAHNVPVTVIGPSVVYDVPYPRLMVSALRMDDPALAQRHLEGSIKGLDAEMSQLARTHGIAYVSLVALECMVPSCAIAAGERPLLFDQEHFTREGSVLIAQKLRDGRIGW